MKKLNKVICVLLTAVLCMAVLSACTGKRKETSADPHKINVVASIFPEYDFLRQIGGDCINLTMLLTPGAESHSFEPTPKDMKEVIASDLFVYVGGDSDSWVEFILDSVDKNKTHIVTLMDCVDTVEEEVVDGMTPEEEEAEEHDADHNGDDGHEHEEEEVEYDEHVWTSPRNAKLICEKLCAALCEIDPANKETYEKNTADYTAKLDGIDQEFKDVVNNGTRKEIIVGDRFPFRYLVDAYDLKYYAAFPGCSTDTDASAATIAFLVDKVKNDKIPVVFHIELSNEKVSKAICEQTGAKNMQLNAVHNITKADFEAGVTYLDLMKQNVEVLKEALK